jgi:hypothetical protein
MLMKSFALDFDGEPRKEQQLVVHLLILRKNHRARRVHARLPCKERPSTMYQSECLFNKSNVTASTAFLKSKTIAGRWREPRTGKRKKIY